MASIIQKQPPTAKNISLYVNGDCHHKGKRLVIQRNVNNMDHFFEIATQCLRPNFGAVRNLYTPDGGTRVKSFSQIHSGKSYVAGGKEHFKCLTREAKYEEIGTTTPRAVKKTYSHIRPVIHNHRLTETTGRYKQAVQEINQPVQLWLHVNGDNQSNPIRLLLPSRILKLKWQMILEYVTDRVGIRLGHAVRKLYTTDGDEIPNAKSLQTGRTYIACGSERFRQLNYKEGKNTNVSHLHILKRKPLPPIGIKMWRQDNENEETEHHLPFSIKHNQDKKEFDNMVEKMQKSKKK